MFNKHNLRLIIWLTFITILMGVPGGYFPKVHSYLQLLSPDKIVHILLFSILYLLIFNVLKNSISSINISKTNILAILFGTIYGILTEIFQKFIFIRRDGNLYDLIADIVGLFFGLWFFTKIYPKNKID